VINRLSDILRNPNRSSYLVIILMILSVSWLGAAPLLLMGLFSYLALSRLHFFQNRGKWLAVGLFLVLLALIAWVSLVFTTKAVRAFPQIADKAIPSFIELAQRYEVELPFTDYETMKEAAMGAATSEVSYLGSAARYAQGALMKVLYLIAGCVVAISLFLNPRFNLEPKREGPPNLYNQWGEALMTRFRVFYTSFETVIGAQIIISAINTVLTAIFVVAVQLPYGPLVIMATFFCGLLPVIGNLISNTIIVGIGITVSPQLALTSLIYLITIHKLEYFLNSRIIGHRIRNPLWLTLLGLVIGERLMGIAGIILAPVVLNYVRLEASAMKAAREPAEAASAPEGGASGRQA
jgi:predicted PurR-regulated permease PerM